VTRALLFVITIILTGIILLNLDAFADNNQSTNGKEPIAPNSEVTSPNLYQWLQHPLVVEIAGSLIALILIPFFTRKWQDRQNEISQKRDLVEKISEAVTAIIESMSFRFVVNDISQKEKNFREWRSKTAVIGAEIRTYFRDRTIPDDWNDLVYFPTNDFFLLFEGLDMHNSQRHYDDLKNYVDTYIQEKSGKELDDEDKKLVNDLTRIKWDLIGKECVGVIKIDFTNTGLQKMWQSIYHLVNSRKYIVINEILQGEVFGFSDKIFEHKETDKKSASAKPD